MDGDYQPITCALQDRYERAIITGRALSLEWHSDDGRVLRDRVHILDLETAEGAEYARFADSRGAVDRVRLDRARFLDPA